MMLCKADFEDLFPELFGTEPLKGATWHPTHDGLSARPGSDAPFKAEEHMTRNAGTNAGPASVPRSQNEDVV